MRVVAAFYPLAEIAERVGGTAATVTNLTPPAAEPHDVELDADQVDALLDADVVLYLGDDFQPAVAELAGRSDGEAIDLLGPLGGDDPHVWLNPSEMQRMVVAVRDALQRAAPEHEDLFTAGARAFLDELEDLDVDFGEQLADCERRTIVTSHAAFGHLARRYGLTQEAVTGLSPEAEPDPERLGELADLVERDGITTVFAEELVSRDVAETLAREAGVAVAVLDPLEGLSDDKRDDGADYLSVMRENLQALRRALGCR